MFIENCENKYGKNSVKTSGRQNLSTYFPDTYIKNGGAQRHRIWHTCLEFKNTS